MNQYAEKPRVAALLRSPIKENSTAKVVNGMVEIIIDGERVLAPSMEAFAKLAAKVASLEQRLNNVENKTNRVRRE